MRWSPHGGPGAGPRPVLGLLLRTGAPVLGVAGAGSRGCVSLRGSALNGGTGAAAAN